MGRMLKKSWVLSVLPVHALAVAGGLWLGLSSVSARADTLLNIPLNNDTAGPASGCPDDGNAYWHFVITPNSGNSEFVEFFLNVGDASLYDTTSFIPNGGQNDNVFVAVPSGHTPTDLDKTGSSANVNWNDTSN